MLNIKSAAFAITGLLTFDIGREKLLQMLDCGIIGSRSSVLGKFNVHGIIGSSLFFFHFFAFFVTQLLGFFGFWKQSFYL